MFGKRPTEHHEGSDSAGLGVVNDQTLVKSMLGGDEQSFRLFFDTYFPRVYRFAAPRLGGDHDACKEVVQAALTKAVRSLNTFRGESALFSWLCQICRHEIVDYLRAHKRRTDRIVLIEDQPELRAALESIEAPAEEQPAHKLSREQAQALVRSVLDRLPSRYGDVLEWKYVEGRSVEEIGDLLGIGHAAAQSMLARARTAFREALETVFGATAQDVLTEMLSGN
jgi:RNA polymerase sigma-70 factor (ECF subfamily)